MNRLFLIIACSIICACSKHEVVKTIKIDTKNNKTIPILEIKSIIPIETDSNYLIGEITSLSVIGNYIYIFDKRYAKSLFQFNINGGYKNKTSFGKGPKELITPRDFYYDIVNEKIYIWDSGSQQMKEFDLMLNFLTSKNFNNLVIRSFLKLQDSNWLVLTANNDYINDSKSTPIKYYNYFVYSSDFKKIKQKFLPLEEKFLSVTLVKPISKSKHPLFCRPFDLTLYKLNDQNKEEIAYSLDFGNYNLLKSDYEKPMAYIFDKQRNGKITANIEELSNTENFICFHYPLGDIINYSIYSMRTKKVYLSQNIVKNNILPKGIVKEILNDDTFVLVVEAQDFIDFCENTKEYKYIGKIKPSSNPVIVTFKIKEI